MVVSVSNYHRPYTIFSVKFSYLAVGHHIYFNTFINDLLLTTIIGFNSLFICIYMECICINPIFKLLIIVIFILYSVSLFIPT